MSGTIYLPEAKGGFQAFLAGIGKSLGEGFGKGSQAANLQNALTKAQTASPGQEITAATAGVSDPDTLKQLIELLKAQSTLNVGKADLARMGIANTLGQKQVASYDAETRAKLNLSAAHARAYEAQAAGEPVRTAKARTELQKAQLEYDNAIKMAPVQQQLMQRLLGGVSAAPPAASPNGSATPQTPQAPQAPQSQPMGGQSSGPIPLSPRAAAPTGVIPASVPLSAARPETLNQLLVENSLPPQQSTDAPASRAASTTTAAAGAGVDLTQANIPSLVQQVQADPTLPPDEKKARIAAMAGNYDPSWANPKMRDALSEAYFGSQPIDPRQIENMRRVANDAITRQGIIAEMAMVQIPPQIGVAQRAEAAIDTIRTRLVAAERRISTPISTYDMVLSPGITAKVDKYADGSDRFKVINDKRPIDKHLEQQAAGFRLFISTARALDKLGTDRVAEQGPEWGIAKTLANQAAVWISKQGITPPSLLQTPNVSLKDIATFGHNAFGVIQMAGAVARPGIQMAEMLTSLAPSPRDDPSVRLAKSQAMDFVVQIQLKTQVETALAGGKRVPPAYQEAYDHYKLGARSFNDLESEYTSLITAATGATYDPRTGEKIGAPTISPPAGQTRAMDFWKNLYTRLPDALTGGGSTTPAQPAQRPSAAPRMPTVSPGWGINR